VVDDGFVPVALADAYLHELRFGRGRAVSTTKAYAENLALFFGWASRSGCAVENGPRELGRFVHWLRSSPVERRGTGFGRARSGQRINTILVSVRELYKHAVSMGSLDGRVLEALYVVGDDRFYPAHVRREDGALRSVLRPLHRVSVTRRASVDDAKPEEFAALLGACESWRDRFLLAVMYLAGLRLGEVLHPHRLAPSERANANGRLRRLAAGKRHDAAVAWARRLVAGSSPEELSGEPRSRVSSSVRDCDRLSRAGTGLAAADAKETVLGLAADAAGAERAGVCADLLECAGEGFDVVVGEVLGEVSFDSVSVVAAGAVHRFGAVVGEHDQDRASVVFGAHAADEPGLLHPVDEAREAAFAVHDPRGELAHRDAVGRFLEVDQDVVPAQRQAGLVLEFGVEHAVQRQPALEEQPQGAQPLRRRA
jgi:hypothetical protein